MAVVTQGKICVLGAGGGVGACIWDELRHDYTLRLADLDDWETVRTRHAGAPAIYPRLLEPPESPHEWVRFDVGDPASVSEAVAGCDAVINLTVNRGELEPAFRVNVGGVANILQAALEHRVKRVIHTGVWARVNGFEGDYRYEFDLADDVPTRAGTRIYPHTKSLGLDVVDAFAREYPLDVMTFLLSRLRPAEALDDRNDNVFIPFSVSFRDLGRAYRCGLQAPELPGENERFFICARTALRKYNPEKAARLLGWEALDRFEPFYDRRHGLPFPPEIDPGS